MSISGGRVTRPVGLYEVASLLGCEPIINQCCLSPHINKWSRKKPMFIGSGKPDSPWYTDPIWKQYDFGLRPPDIGVVIGSDIVATAENNPDWNAQEWIFDPWRYGNGFLRLTDFDGYFHNVGAPFDVPGMILPTYESSFNGSTSSDDNNIVFDIDIPVNPPMGGIGMFELPQFLPDVTGEIGYRLCLLARCISGSDKGEWFVHEDSKLISAYKDQAGLMESIKIQLSVNDMRRKYDNIIDMPPTWGDYMDLEWWLCASVHSSATNEKWQGIGWNQPVDMFDATTQFMSLPTSRPEACHGKVTYSGRATSVVTLEISFWGVNNNNYWMPYMGLLPVNDVIQFGQMLQDYTYGLQVGITIKNTTQDDRVLDKQLFMRYIRARISKTFDNENGTDWIFPNIYLSTSTQTNVSLDGKLTDFGIYSSEYVWIAKNSSISLILDFGTDVMGMMGTTPEGQNISFDVMVQIQNYYNGSQTFQGRN